MTHTAYTVSLSEPVCWRDKNTQVLEYILRNYDIGCTSQVWPPLSLTWNCVCVCVYIRMYVCLFIHACIHIQIHRKFTSHGFFTFNKNEERKREKKIMFLILGSECISLCMTVHPREGVWQSCVSTLLWGVSGPLSVSMVSNADVILVFHDTHFSYNTGLDLCEVKILFNAQTKEHFQVQQRSEDWVWQT